MSGRVVETPSGLVRDTLLRLTRMGMRVFRNNVGLGWVGKAEHIKGAPCTMTIYPGDVIVRQARPLHAGLIEGSSDIVGWESVVIGPGDIGKRVAVFAAVECKMGSGRLTPEQKQFLEVVKQAGGIARVARENGVEEL